LSVLVLFASVYNRSHIKDILYWVKQPSFFSLFEIFETFAYGGPRFTLEDIRLDTKLLIVPRVLSFIYLVIFVKGLFSIKKRSHYRASDHAKLLFFWISVPVLFVYVYSYTVFPIYILKHFLICLPAFCFVVAVGIGTLGKRNVRITALLIISALTLFPLNILYKNDFNSHWNKAAAFVKLHAKDDAIVIISNLVEIMPFIYHFDYGNKSALARIDMFGKIGPKGWQESFYYGNNLLICIDEAKGRGPHYLVEDFKNKVLKSDIISGGREIWLLVSRWTDEDASEKMIEILSKYFEKRPEMKFNGIDVYHFTS